MLNILVTAIGHFPTELENWGGQMDSYREHPSDFDQPSTAESSVADDVAAARLVAGMGRKPTLAWVRRRSPGAKSLDQGAFG